MQRTMTGFHQDDLGDWVAELSCLHRQHIRHQPPFWEAAWIDDPDTRTAHIGALLECPLCDRAQLPDNLRVVRRTAKWSETSVPAGLRGAHRIAAGTWGLLEVEVGTVRLIAETTPRLDVTVTVGRPQPIPPELDHHIEVGPDARFHVTFLARREISRKN